MPIHQTKLIIAKPQATGTFRPQIPVPVNTSLATASWSSITRPKPIAKIGYIQRGVLPKTTALIFLVTVAGE